MPTYKGKVFIILQADTKLGLELVRQLARKGARLVLQGDHRDRLEGAVSEAMRYGGEAILVPMDILTQEQYLCLRIQALAAYGRIDYLIMNTGCSTETSFLDWNGYQYIQQAFSRYLSLPVYAVQLCLPHLAHNNGSVLIFQRTREHIPRPCTKSLVAFITELSREFKANGDPVRILTLDIGEEDIGNRVRIARAAVYALGSRATFYQVEGPVQRVLRKVGRWMYPKWLMDILYCRCRGGGTKKTQ